MDAACLPGNPDIRVPEALKVDDGLRVWRASEGRDAGEDAEGDAEKEKGGHGDAGRHPTMEELRTPSVQDLAETEEVSEGRKLRHIPGGTWLNQVRSYLMTVYG
ncbi:hypothetical protein NDU88_006184 [Pleurodeles waltl]|uniref:Uncharacterized protein n=1 Tax=Pleurodeles waltl TaxID=8319 RepID=A0AAV7VL98_PLEWA|nr:hypothetical protein NDU88_006184 [Pleurodeles waltl]